ncbi:MAG: hypothetical protein KC593_02525 [Myxococcales bacterium]|nr:hypothetical protein [Myxococcales bacterium]
MTDVLTTIFTNMSRWRHLPAYQLERRADIFFSAYLPAVIAEHTGVPVVADVIPELPIRRDLIWPGKPSRSSVKVDYAVLAQDRSKVFFVELKTDSASRRDSQDTYLSMAAEVGFKRIVQGIVEITQATTAYQKYGHLLHALADRGCVRLPEGLDEHLWPVVRPGLGKLLRDVEVTIAEDEFAVEVVYLQPEAGADGEDCIDFEEFAVHVSRFDDPVSKTFASHLRGWVEAAGSRVP